MPKRTVDLRFNGSPPLLDIVSYGRRGPGHRPPLTSAAIAHASRTVRAVPEVMIKVSGGARTVRGVATHLEYLERHADIETDDGVVFADKGHARELLDDWNLDLHAQRRHTQRGIAAGRRPPKLVHNLVFSMPTGTPPDKLHRAVRKFALEKFGAQHRYALALHTHQGHPHVHMVVKAMSERGERLNIRKATLREWRADFARYLREFGVEANATERAVRGCSGRTLKTPIYRAARHGESSFLRARAESVARELRSGGLKPEAGHAQLSATRREIVDGWRAFGAAVERAGLRDLASHLQRFIERMPEARTDRQKIAEQMMARVRARERAPPAL
jgi:hypothetical protein